jgi:hypothetical protein
MKKPLAYISYSQEDATWVQEFAKALKDRNVEVWLDTWQLRAGDSLPDAMEAGLRGSDAIITVLSAANTRQPNILFELGVALGAGKRLIPIVPADIDGASVPFALRARRSLVKGAPAEAAREVAEALIGKAA